MITTLIEAFLLGLVGFSSQISTFLLAPLAGVIADRHHRYRLPLYQVSISLFFRVVNPKQN